jgi:hypothetical protein
LGYADFRAFWELPPSISIHPFELILLKPDALLAKPLIQGLLSAWSAYRNHHDRKVERCRQSGCVEMGRAAAIHSFAVCAVLIG